MSDYADEIAAREMPSCACEPVFRDYSNVCIRCSGFKALPILFREDLARIIREAVDAAVKAEREAILLAAKRYLIECGCSGDWEPCIKCAKFEVADLIIDEILARGTP